MTIDELNEVRFIEGEIRTELVRLHLKPGKLWDLVNRLAKVHAPYKLKEGPKA